MAKTAKRVTAYPTEVRDFIYEQHLSGLPKKEIAENVKKKFSHVKGVAGMSAGRIHNVVYRLNRAKRENLETSQTSIVDIPSLDGATNATPKSTRRLTNKEDKARIVKRIAKLRNLGFRWDSVKEELEKEFPELPIPSVSGLIKMSPRTTSVRKRARVTRKQKTMYKLLLTHPDGTEVRMELGSDVARSVMDTVLASIRRTIMED